MRRAIVRATSCLCLISVGLFSISGIAAAYAPSEQPAVALKPAKQTFAHIRIKGDYAEGPAQEGLFSAMTERLADGIARIDKAGDDKEIAGIVLQIKEPAIGWAKLNEFRKAVARVRAKGKKVYGLIESGTPMEYLLATSCDQIIMPESGMLMLIGLRAEITFYKNLFDKLSVNPEMMRVGEYKSAGEPFTRSEMSPEFRKEMEEIIDDMYRQLVDTVAQGRKLDREKVIAAIDSAPHTAKAAAELGLIDRMAYEDELPAILRGGNDSAQIKITKDYGKKKVDTDFSGFAGFVKMMNMMAGGEEGKRVSSKPKIAVLYAQGEITTGASTADLFGASVLGSDTLVKAIEKIKDDATVKAVVLRVDSPGGSALASDLMWRAIEQLKAAKKPVIVSMGDVAGSGGYYISMGADRIFAEPSTITGSIGVIGGKVALKGLYEKVGVNTTVISRGKNSGVNSSLDGFTESERASMQKSLNEIYDQFTRKAALGRKMPHEQLEKLARGRVYTGATALKIGLVDELGSLQDAIAYAEKQGGFKAGEKVERLELPKARNPFESLFGGPESDAELHTTAAQSVLQALAKIAPELAEHLQSAQLINVLAREGRMTLMPFKIKVK